MDSWLVEVEVEVVCVLEADEVESAVVGVGLEVMPAGVDDFSRLVVVEVAVVEVVLEDLDEDVRAEVTAVLEVVEVDVVTI